MRTLTQYLLPHRIIAKIAHWCANCKVVWIKNYLIGYFIKRYAVKMQEAIEPNPFAYPTYNHFFTRKLKPECRPINPAANSIVSPADGAIAQIGSINQYKLIQAKGQDFNLADLLGGNQQLARQFFDGFFATVYLAPKDYHRVHMPLTGTLEQMIHIPGKLFSVNQHAAKNIPNLFARNERVVCIFNTVAGPMAVILVGAMIVGSIETVWSGVITPPHQGNTTTWAYSGANARTLAKGDELGLFKLGSTVIVLFAPSSIMWDANITTNIDVHMGSKLGTLINGESAHAQR